MIYHLEGRNTSLKVDSLAKSAWGWETKNKLLWKVVTGHLWISRGFLRTPMGPVREKEREGKMGNDEIKAV